MNDERVEDLVDVTKVVDRDVVHVDDEDPDSSVPVLLLLFLAPVWDGETLAPVESVDESSVVVVVHEDDDDVDDSELAGGNNVMSESDSVWDEDEPDEPVLVGVIVSVCTPGEPEPEPEDEVPDLVTVRMLGAGPVAVADDIGTV